MKLLTLSLENFKGVKSFTLDLGGDGAVIYGDNGTGKTSIYDSLLWLILDKDSQFRSLSPKVIDPLGEEIHGLDHTVEAVFLLSSGQALKLKKTLRESWVKKRGSANKVLSGHTTKYWVDGVPVKQKEYKNVISSLIPNEDVFKMLSSPFYFAQVMPWQKRRELLLSIVGDITDAEVVASDPDLAPLPGIIGTHTIDDYKKIVTEKLRDLNKEIQSIPIRIDETSRLLPDVSELDEQGLKNSLGELDKKITAAENLVHELGNPDAGAVKIERDLKTTLIRIRELESQATLAADRRSQDLEMEKQRLEADLKKLEAMVQDGDMAEREMRKNLDLMETLRQDYRELASTSFTPSADNTCPTCGQALPEGQQEEAFKAVKSRRLEAINAQGRGLKARNTELATIIKQGEESTVEIESLNRKITEIDKKREEVVPILSDVHAKLTDTAAGLKKQLSTIADVNNNSDNILAARQDLEGLRQQRRHINDDLEKIRLSGEILERIGSLRQGERLLASELESCEHHKFLIEKFIRSKVALMDSRVVERLDYPGLSVKMFQEQINGGLSECCEVTYLGVGFNTGLNHGAQIAVGVNIINLLSAHLGVSIPLFIDNAEAITVVPEINTQVIQLVVSSEHRELTVVKNNNKNEEVAS